LENSYPNLHANYAEFHEQGLEGPYLWHGETYFFDRKVGGWYSVTEEDFVDDEISKDLSLAYVKDGMYKRQFAS
jgi:lysozyme family protein